MTSIGDTLGPLTVAVTRESLVRYAGASGDFNPIHYSDHQARALGLDGVIAHGMLTMALSLRLVTDWCGDPARVRSHYVRFRRPVPVPDDDRGAELIVTGTVEKVADGIATVRLETVLGEDKVLGQSVAEVRVDG